MRIADSSKSKSLLQRGAALPEYALLMSLLLVVCMGGVRSTGTQSKNAFTRVRLSSASATTGGGGTGGPRGGPRQTHGFNGRGYTDLAGETTRPAGRATDLER